MIDIPKLLTFSAWRWLNYPLKKVWLRVVVSPPLQVKALLPGGGTRTPNYPIRKVWLRVVVSPPLQVKALTMERIKNWAGAVLVVFSVGVALKQRLGLLHSDILYIGLGSSVKSLVGI